MSFQKIKGEWKGNGQKHCIVVAEFNELITKPLLEGAITNLTSLGVAESDITVVSLPGAYELPGAVERILSSEKRKTTPYHSVICLGCVIRGATPHFDYVASESATVGSIGRKYNVPVIFGVLTTDTIEQAIERAGTKAGNKGRDAANTAVEMANLYSKL